MSDNSADPIATAIQLAAVTESVRGMGREIGELKSGLKAHQDSTANVMAEIKKDIKELIELRNKGAGAFWLASLVSMAGFLVVVRAVVLWFRGG